ncbi:MAG: hypothetical protein ACRDTF_23335 [Pseudonocardiaceae bacterium]
MDVDIDLADTVQIYFSREQIPELTAVLTGECSDLPAVLTFWMTLRDGVVRRSVSVFLV